jgi:hypothetical protein
VPGAICSVVGAAESSHLAIVLLAGFLLSTNLNARSRYAEKPRRTISGQEPRACEILCAHWMAEIQGTADRVQRQTL